MGPSQQQPAPRGALSAESDKFSTLAKRPPLVTLDRHFVVNDARLFRVPQDLVAFRAQLICLLVGDPRGHAVDVMNRLTVWTTGMAARDRTAGQTD